MLPWWMMPRFYLLEVGGAGGTAAACWLKLNPLSLRAFRPSDDSMNADAESFASVETGLASKNSRLLSLETHTCQYSSRVTPVFFSPSLFSLALCGLNALHTGFGFTTSLFNVVRNAIGCIELMSAIALSRSHSSSRAGKRHIPDRDEILFLLRFRFVSEGISHRRSTSVSRLWLRFKLQRKRAFSCVKTWEAAAVHPTSSMDGWKELCRVRKRGDKCQDFEYMLAWPRMKKERGRRELMSCLAGTL